MVDVDDVFVEEARHHLRNVEARALCLEEGGDDEARQSLQRSLHTLKGLFATVGAADAARRIHEVEARTTGDVDVEGLLAARDHLEGVVDTLAAGTASDGNAAPPPGRAVRGAAERVRVTSVRVTSRDLDHLVDVATELSLHRSRLLDLHRGSTDRELDDVLGRLDRLTGEIYDRVLDARMLRLGTVFERFPRAVRDLARHHGKEVELVTRGGDAEVDRSVIENLPEPLLHLLRNAVDHGLEAPDERERQGKPRRGTITLAASREQDRVRVTVMDDGRGIDVAAVAARARTLGLGLGGGPGGEPDLARILTRSGFTTRDDVTDTSGRGVGLDAVRAWLDDVGGSLHVATTAREGTRVELTLPATLLMVHGLVVGVGDERYVVPLTGVERTVDLRERDVHHVQGRTLLRYAGETLPLVDLGERLGVPGAPRARHGVVVRHHDRRAAVAVTSLHMTAEAVLMRIPRDHVPDPAVAGGTILSDGATAVVLSVGPLVEPGFDHAAPREEGRTRA